jgi:hypothetical protein
MKKKRIRWGASPSPEVVGYRLYWAQTGDVDYDSDFVDIRHRRGIILPDEVPSLQNAEGRIALGVTAVSLDGNESDLVRFTLFSEPAVPFISKVLMRPASEGWEAPVNTSILFDDLHHWVIRDVPSLPSGGPCKGDDYFIDSHHIDEMRR